MKIYLAGPMRGYKDFNFPAFFDAEVNLKLLGYTVFNPARRDVDAHGPDVCKSETGDLKDIAHVGFNHRETMKCDLSWICDEAEAIALLPGWEKSKGATAEKALADCLGLSVMHL